MVGTAHPTLQNLENALVPSDRGWDIKAHNQRVLTDLIRNFERTRGAAFALQQASLHGLVEEVARLLDMGTDVDSPDERLITPLMLACNSGERKVVELLVNRGANVDAKKANGGTPLHSLMGGLHRETTIASITKLLLAAGADPSVRNAEGKTALDLAQEKYGDKVCSLLRETRT